MNTMRIYTLEEAVADLIPGIKLSTLRTLCVTGRIKAKKAGKRWYITEPAIRQYFLGER